MLLTKDKSFYKSLFLLAIPIALQNLISFSVTFADNVMISSLGDSAVSGVYIANQIQVLLQLISGGIEGAILVLGAQYRGKGDTASVRKIAAIGAVISVCIGILLTTVCIFSPIPSQNRHVFLNVGLIIVNPEKTDVVTLNNAGANS